MRFIPLGMIGLLACSVAPMVQAQLSGSVGVVSLYKSRGIDQDDKDRSFRPALQASVRYDWESGLYLYNWNSTGRFGQARVEMDVGGGYTRQLANGLSYDVGYVHYIYPGEGSWNSREVYVGLSYERASVYVYRGMRSNVNQGDWYVALNYSHPLTERLSVTMGLGFLDYHAQGMRSRTDASLGLAYALKENLTLSLQVQAANRKRDAWNGERDTRVIAGLVANF